MLQHMCSILRPYARPYIIIVDHHYTSLACVVLVPHCFTQVQWRVQTRAVGIY